jgi:hypothetical protein
MLDRVTDNGARIAERIRIAKERLSSAESEWIAATIEVAEALLEGRVFCGNDDRAFGRWLTEHGIDFNPNDRSALVKMARHPELFRKALAKTARRSYQHIWATEIRPSLVKPESIFTHVRIDAELAPLIDLLLGPDTIERDRLIANHPEECDRFIDRACAVAGAELGIDGREGEWPEVTLSDDVRLICGDCRDIIPGLAEIDVTITDPPYGVNLRNTGGYRGAHRESVTHFYDDRPATARELIKTAMPVLLEKCERALIFCSSRTLRAFPQEAEIGSVYSRGAQGRSRWGFKSSQPILYYGKDPNVPSPDSFEHQHGGGEGFFDHPSPKPLAWMRWAVDKASREDETVLDPFMGTGQTGIACIEKERRFIGIEKEREYFFDTCIRLLHAMTSADLLKAGARHKARRKRPRLAQR